MAGEELIEGEGEELIEGAEGTGGQEGTEGEEGAEGTEGQEGTEGEEGAEGAAAHTPQSRKEARVQKLANERAEALAEARAAREQAEFYKRQAEQLAQQHKPPQDDVYVDPDEKWRRETEGRVNHALFSAQDLNDKASYTLKAAKNPLYSKYEDRVEKQLQEVRAKGGNANREGVLAYLIGQDALANSGKPTPAARAAKQRIDAARTTTPGVKSTVAAPRKEQSAEERLRGVIL